MKGVRNAGVLTRKGSCDHKIRIMCVYELSESEGDSRGEMIINIRIQDVPS